MRTKISNKKYIHIGTSKPEKAEMPKDTEISKETEEYLAKNRNKNLKHKESATRKTVENYTRNIFFKQLKEILTNAEIANEYLFKVVKEHLQGMAGLLPNGLYKVQIVEKNKEGMMCYIKGTNDFQQAIFIKMEDIIAAKNTKIKTKRVGESVSEYLEEFQENDSCIIKIHDKGDAQVIEKIDTKNLLYEIKDYIHEKRGFEEVNAKNISTILKFLGESKNNYAKTFMKDITKFSEEENGSNKELEMKVFGTQKKEEIKKILKSNPKKRTEYLTERKEQLRNNIIKLFQDPNIPIYIHQENDIDNQGALFLLRKSKIFNPNKEVFQINQGDEKSIDKGIFIDIGETASGFKRTGDKIIFSEHAEGSDEAFFTHRPNSTTHIIYTLFKKLGLFEKQELEQLGRFVEFVDKVDSMNYQMSGIDYENNYRTIIGLHKQLLENRNIGFLFKYFKSGKNTGFEILSDTYLQETFVRGKEGARIPLKVLSDKKKKEIEKNMQKFNELKSKGYELKYEETSFIVDIQGNLQDRLKDGPQVAGYNNSQDAYGFFTIYPQRKNLYIYNPKVFPPRIEGFDSKDHFLVLQDPTVEDFEKILKKFHTTPNSKQGLKAEIKNYLISVKLRAKEGQNRKPETLAEMFRRKGGETSTFTIKEEKTLKDESQNYGKLPLLKKSDLQIGKNYKGIVNNTFSSVAFITLDQKGHFAGVLHKSEISDQPGYIKSLKKGDEVQVKIKDKKREKDKQGKDKLKINLILA